MRNQPNAHIQHLARLYCQQEGLPIPQEHTPQRITDQMGTALALAYEEMTNAPYDRRIQCLWSNFAWEIDRQLRFLRRHGLVIAPWFNEGQPYADSQEMQADVRDNGHLYVYTGGDDHPCWDRLTNIKFRAVHDIFGHCAGGWQFGKHGELNAWIEHSKMFTREVLPALTVETLGQNAWVNFSEKNRGRPAAERSYADQKVGLLPESLWRPALNMAMGVTTC